MNIQQYRELSRDEYQCLKIRGMITMPYSKPPEWKKVYVCPNLKERNSGLFWEATEHFLLKEVETYKYIAFIGEAGSGKTSLLRFLAYTLLQGVDYLPWVVEKGVSLLEQIEKKVCLPQDEILQCKWLFLFDDFALPSYTQKKYPEDMNLFSQSRFIFSSAQTIDMPEIERTYHIECLNEEQIDEFIYLWYRLIFAEKTTPRREAISSFLRVLDENNELRELFSLRKYLLEALMFHFIEGTFPQNIFVFFERFAQKILPENTRIKKILHNIAHEYTCSCDSLSLQNITDTIKRVGKFEEDETEEIASCLKKILALPLWIFSQNTIQVRFSFFKSYLTAEYIYTFYITRIDQLSLQTYVQTTEKHPILLIFFNLMQRHPEALEKLIANIINTLEFSPHYQTLLFLAKLLFYKIEITQQQKQKIVDILRDIYINAEEKQWIPDKGQKLESVLMELNHEQKLFHHFLKDIKINAWKKMTKLAVHKISNRTAPISMDLGLLKSRIENVSQVNPLMDRVIQKFDKLVQTLSEIDKFSHIFEYKLEYCNIANILQECIDDLHLHEKCVFEKISSEVLWKWDKKHIKDVFLELLNNSLRHSKVEVLQLQIKTEVQNNQYKITIADNGKGIPVEKKEAIFDPFVTTHPQGSGLGLFYVKEIIVAHYGEIRERGTDKGVCWEIIFTRKE